MDRSQTATPRRLGFERRAGDFKLGLYRERIFPRLCDLALGRRAVADLRRETLADANGETLEIGFGTGLNLPHYPQSVSRLTVVEPNAGMHRLAKRRLGESSLDVRIHQSSGERLEFDDGEFETVVSAFTLCSIGDVESALAEIFRVLKPGGRFLFLEHGLSPDPGVQRWQRRLNGLEQWMFDGCRLDRDVASLIASQPFDSRQVDQFYMASFPRTHTYIYRGMGRK